MPGYTTNYSFPYPLAGDPIYLGATQQKDMADAIDLALKAANTPGTPTPPTASLLVAAGGVSIPNNTITPISWATADYDLRPVGVAAAFASNRLYCRVAGKHQIEVLWPWTTNGSGSRSMYLYKNGTATGNVIDLDGRPPTSLDVTNRISTQLHLAAGDYLTIGLFQNSGGALTGGANVYGGLRGRISMTWIAS